MPHFISRRFLLVFYCLFVCTFFSHPLQALTHDPALAWSTVPSEHFDLHFHQGLESLAPSTLALCERRYNELSDFFKFHPESKIQIVLADETDAANGSATALPYNTIQLIVAPPDELEQVDEVDAWMDYVISHELTHIFHLDHERGFPYFLRAIFGRIPWTTPNYFQPPWMIEGLATWAETDAARAVGRGKSPFFRGLMRTELKSGLKTLRTVNQPLRTWPAGNTRYLYGVYFMQFLEARYGKDSLRQWVENYSGDWIPFFINMNAKKTFGKNLPALWKEFEEWLQADLGKETEAIEAAGLRGQVEPVEPDAGDYWGPYKGGYAVRRDGLSRPRLQRLVAGQWQTVGEAFVVSFWPGKTRILYTENEVLNQSLQTRDLWEMDKLSGRRQRLTEGLRVQEAVETSVGLIAVLGNLGQKEIVRLDAGQVAETLWQGSDDENISSICPSPDGGKLAASVWRRGQGWNIEEFDLATKTWTAVASRPESEIQPSYSPDGKTIFFSAAYGGTFNLYGIDLASRHLHQWTNVIGGAFHPWTDDGVNLYFSMLSAQGYVLGEVTMDNRPGVDIPATATTPPQLKAAPTPVIASARPYSVWPTLWPSAWFPIFGYDYLGGYYGLYFFGDDVLDRHHFATSLYTTDEGRRKEGWVDYSYTRYFPKLSLGYSHTNEAEGGYSYATARIYAKDKVSVFVDMPWIDTWKKINFSLGALAATYRDDGGNERRFPLDSYNKTIVWSGLSYDSTTRPRRALGNVDGLQAQVSYTQSIFGLLPTTGSNINDPYQSNRDSSGWVYWSLARPSSLGRGFELETSVGGGIITLGPLLFYSRYERPEAFAPPRNVSMTPTFSLSSNGNFGSYDAFGPVYGNGHLGLRFPLGLVERGMMAPPIGLDRFHGKVAGDMTQLFDESGIGYGWRSSVTAELDVDMVFFYSVPMDVQLGYVVPIDRNEFSRIFLRVNGVRF